MKDSLAVDINNLIFSMDGGVRLDIPTLQIENGDTIMIHGENGSGKTVLLKTLSGLLKPDSGSIKVLEHDLVAMSESQCDQFRADFVGYIFQSLHLLPYLSALDNILLPCGFSSRKKKYLQSLNTTPEYEAFQIMGQLYLEDPQRLRRQTDQLSKGLQQRVAIARALIGQPRLILADEPASALDINAKKDVYKLLVDHSKQNGSTLICICHGKHHDWLFDRVLSMEEINRIAEANPLW